MRKIIFLDVDGVLNCRTTTEKVPGWGYRGVENRFIKNLRKIQNETGAEIVLSSSWKDGWRTEYGECKRWIQYLRDELDKEGLSIADVTPREKFWSKRGESIRKWLDINETDSFVVLDDKSTKDYSENDLCGCLIQVNPTYGLTEEDADGAIAILNNPVQAASVADHTEFNSELTFCSP